MRFGEVMSWCVSRLSQCQMCDLLYRRSALCTVCYTQKDPHSTYVT